MVTEQTVLCRLLPMSDTIHMQHQARHELGTRSCRGEGLIKIYRSTVAIPATILASGAVHQTLRLLATLQGPADDTCLFFPNEQMAFCVLCIGQTESQHANVPVTVSLEKLTQSAAAMVQQPC